MRILITGSRTWPDPQILRDAILEVLKPAPGSVHTIVHGGAVGADSMADAVARSLGLVVEAHPAYWTIYGKRAGYVRNSDMVSLGADICLAFIHNNSRGATMCANLAQRAGIEVRRYFINTEKKNPNDETTR